MVSGRAKAPVSWEDQIAKSPFVKKLAALYRGVGANPRRIFDHLLLISCAAGQLEEMRIRWPRQRSEEASPKRRVTRLRRDAIAIEEGKAKDEPSEFSILPELLNRYAAYKESRLVPASRGAPRWKTILNYYIREFSTSVWLTLNRDHHAEVAGACTDAMRVVGSKRSLNEASLKMLVKRNRHLGHDNFLR
jgi:hypothetical protein